VLLELSAEVAEKVEYHEEGADFNVNKLDLLKKPLDFLLNHLSINLHKLQHSYQVLELTLHLVYDRTLLQALFFERNTLFSGALLQPSLRFLLRKLLKVLSSDLSHL
jgi:hypothetical protein